jgi:uncharacterized protein YndB with AHSA1/START domain
MNDLPYHLNRSVLIKASPETVFRFFTDSARWASWWGSGSTIEAVPGGKVYIRHPNGIESLGEVIEVRDPESISFTYGFVSGKPIPPGSSRVTIRLEPNDAGTRLHLLHEFAESGPRDEHVQGWRFQLALFANAVANEAYAGADTVVDTWFDGWATPDDTSRRDLFNGIVRDTVVFRDRYSLLDGLEDLVAHTGAAQRFMPGIRMKRKGNVRQCQGMALADWTAVNQEGKELMSGTNVFEFGPDGRLGSVAGFTS